MRLDKRDRETIEFAKMQQDMYGCAGVFFILCFVVYGILRLFGITGTQIIAWLIEKGVLLPK